MDITARTPLLGGLSPQTFMRRHWQRKPHLVRAAVPGVLPPVSRAALFEMAANADIESRLVVRGPHGFTVRHGPMRRRALPPLRQAAWTLLVQGVDLHIPQAHRLLSLFRFVPDARLDDVMISWASDGGGVGAHLDSYDVFLLQVQGRRRWRIGPVTDATWQEDQPLKVLRRFEPQQEWLLEPGDMLYLPPMWGHDGVAEGECMTCSIGFRSPSQGALSGELLQRLGEDASDDERTAGQRLYRDAGAAATATPGAIPLAMQAFARHAAEQRLLRPQAIERALGESLTEPKPQVWFAGRAKPDLRSGVTLDRATRMMYDDHYLFINGESFLSGGRDARLMRQLADRRRLEAPECRALSGQAVALLADWLSAGWLHGGEP